MLAELFDGSTQVHKFDPLPTLQLACTYQGFEQFDGYCVSHYNFKDSEVHAIRVLGVLRTETVETSLFTHCMSNNYSLGISCPGDVSVVGGVTSLMAGGKMDAPFAGFLSNGELRFYPKGVSAAKDSLSGCTVSPLLVVMKKRLLCNSDSKRVRQRLVLGQLENGETVFVIMKNCDVTKAANIAVQLGCKQAAIMANDSFIEVYSRGPMINRNQPCHTAFVL